MKEKHLIVTKYTWASFQKKFEEIRKIKALSKSIESVDFVLDIRDVGTPKLVRGINGMNRIDSQWFEENISLYAKVRGFTHAKFLFSIADGEKWVIDSGIKGSNFRDGDFFGESWIKSDEKTVTVFKDVSRNTFVRTFCHEDGHEYNNQKLTTLLVHDFDYTKTSKDQKINNIEGFYTNLHIEQKSFLNTLYQKILNLTTIKKFLETPMLPLTNFENVSQHFLVKNKTYKSGVHNGTDWAVRIGTPIFAPCNGYISKVYKNHTTMGNACYFVFKYQDQDYTMRILHLSKVPVLSTYLKGETIAVSGNTGKSTGPHVHIDLWKNKVVDTALLYTKQGVVNNLIDPYKFFKGIIE